MEHAHWKTNARLVSEYISFSASTVEWMKNEIGLPITHTSGYYPGAAETIHNYADFRRIKITNLMRKRAEELHVQIFCQHSILGLVQSSTDTFSYEGTDECGRSFAGTAKAVISAAGGFGGDPKMVHEAGYTMGKDLMYTFDLSDMDGSGIRMLWALGAKKAPMMMDTYMGLAQGYGGPMGTAPKLSALRQPYNLMVNQKGYRFLREDLVSNPGAVAIAAGDVFKNGGVPAIGVTCTNPQVTEGNDNYFRICFLDPFQGTVLANFAYGDLKAKKAYCLSKQGDDYSAGVCNYFVQAFKALGGEVVEEAFPDGNSDFTSYVTNAKSQGCDVFFAPVSIEAAANIIKQAQTQGLEIPMLASDTWDSNVVAEAAKGTNMNIYVTTFYQEGGSPDFDSGIKEYINSDSTALANNGGNDQLAAVSAMGYDAYFVALEALKAAGSTDPAEVLKALPNVSYTGVTGIITFGENGDANRTSAFIKKCNTETAAWELVREQGVE